MASTSYGCGAILSFFDFFYTIFRNDPQQFIRFCTGQSKILSCLKVPVFVFFC